MKKIRITSVLLASCLLLGSAVSSKSETVNDPNEPSTAAVQSSLKPEIIMKGSEPVTQASTVPRPADLEQPVAAKSGDLCISVSDGDMMIQYNGSGTDPRHTMLSYNAGVAPVTGNGDYTVSVTAATKGFRFDMTGDENNTSVLPEGLQFLAVVYKEGKKLNPKAVITVKSVRVDGQEVPLKSKAYTASDDGVDLKANIYNQWTNTPTSDALSADGPLYTGGQPAAFFSEYSPRIIDDTSFAKWTTLEIDVSVSGIE